VRCRACGAESAPEGFRIRCGACDGTGVDVIQGEELLLRDVEMEVGGEEPEARNGAPAVGSDGEPRVESGG
jgi:hypothetical protein